MEEGCKKVYLEKKSDQGQFCPPFLTESKIRYSSEEPYGMNEILFEMAFYQR